VVENLDLKTRPGRLNRLATINSAKTYLEIGVATGSTFKRVKVPRKTGVDPKFLFDTATLSNEFTSFHEITSDKYFSTTIKANESFDLIHIDGLHTFEQTLRDFCASLGTAHSRTIWLIDDTHPESYAQANRSQQASKKIKQATGEKGAQWMGDVFKVVAFIHDFFPQFSFASFPDHGQTVVWQQTRKAFKPLWNSTEAIERLSFADFLSHRETIFQSESYDTIFAKLEAHFN